MRIISEPHRTAAFSRACMVAVASIALAYFVSRSATQGLDALSYDSLRYLGGAESIRLRGAYLDLNGLPQQVWPPGTSLLYASLSTFTGASVEGLIRPVNAIAFIISLGLFGSLVEGLCRGAFARTVAFAAFALNGVFLSQYTKLWSDPIALPLLLGVLWLLLRQKNEALPPLIVPVAVTSLVAAGIMFRFAMLALVPVAVLQMGCDPRIRKYRWLPLLSPVAVVVSLSALGARSGSRSFTAGRADWHGNLAAFEKLSAQFLPQVLPPLLMLVLSIAILIVMPALMWRRFEAFPLFLWIGGYAAFLCVAQVIAQPSFAMDLRVLFPLYPAIVLLGAGSIEVEQRWMRYVVLLVLSIAALRGAHYAYGSIMTTAGAVPVACVTREQIVADLRRRPVAASVLVSNAQGLVWYATRKPTFRPLDFHRPDHAEAIFVDERTACAGAIDDPMSSQAPQLRSNAP